MYRNALGMEKLPQANSTSPFLPWAVQLPAKAPVMHWEVLPEKNGRKKQLGRRGWQQPVYVSSATH